MKFSIIKRLKLIFIAFMAIVIILPLCIHSFQTIKMYKKRDVETLSLISELSSVKISENIIRKNIYGAGRLVYTICDSLKMSRCELIDGNDKIIYQTDLDNVKREDLSKLEFDLIYIGRYVGKIKFYSKGISFSTIFGGDFGIVILFIILLSLVVFYFLKKNLVQNINEMSTFFELFDEQSLDQTITKIDKNLSNSIEIEQLQKYLVDKMKKLIVSEKKNKESLANFKMAELSKQVAHDLRSPLACLQSAISDIDKIKYSKRRLILSSLSRITNIANDLLAKEIVTQSTSESSNIKFIIDDLISQKNIESSAQFSVNISETVSDLFFKGNSTKLYRSLSNIINNGVEANNNDAALITINVVKLAETIEVSIKDNGQGMSAVEMREMLKGGYTSKDKGNGIGVVSSIKFIESMNGSVEFKSELGIGTEVKITLQSEVSADWFVGDKLTISEANVICIDDDSSFLQLYDKKLGTLFPELTLSPYTKTVEEHFYFVDYDLSSNQTGLDFIIEKKLQSKSILVTSMYVDQEVKRKAIENSVKICPKRYFDDLIIEVSSSKPQRVVLIDDDSLIHLFWKISAEKENLIVDTYFDVESFLEKSSLYESNTNIYVDSNLSNNSKGEVESEKISKLGFSNIYLSTGYSKDDIEKPSWIHSVIGKDFPNIITKK
ncbi:MAG: signal transduction histidine kinase [Thermoproteota archaeon]|jgi:signal transduction histidine kinase